MQIIYPYNEILPLKKAHDAYIIRWCASLAGAGHDVSLLIGQGSLDRKSLFKFYKISPDNPLKIIYLPILRRKNVLRLQANALFFWFAQRQIEKEKPDLVIFSVMKQAKFHLKRKVKGCLYLYEVHQLSFYPSIQKRADPKRVRRERQILQACDFLTVTTNPLKDILRHDPYKLTPPIEKIPLACDFEKIESTPRQSEIFQLFYVGQLYLEQGLRFLLQALQEVEGVRLTILGGKPHEVEALHRYCEGCHLTNKVHLLGFKTPEELQIEVQHADAFITTFLNKERMPYVAHTKLCEYRAWQRPILAPNLPVVHEEVSKGALYFESGEVESLKKALCQIQSKSIYDKLWNEIQHEPLMNWEKRGCLFNKVLNKMRIAHKTR